MRRANGAGIALGASLMLALCASSGGAQARSQERIRITKSASGEVVKVDTIHDTITVKQVDTVVVPRIVTQTRTIVETTTVQLPPLPRIIRYPDGMYLGIAAGVSQPAGSLFNPNNTGPSGQFQGGYQRVDFPFGLRLDANYLRPGQDGGYAHINNNAGANFWNLNADLKVALPVNGQSLGISRRLGLYILGGPSYSTFNHALIELNPGSAGTTGGANVGYAPDWQHQWGWNAGGGASLVFDRLELFLESRVIAFNPNNSHQARQIPIVFGLNWFGASAQQQR